MEPPDRYLFIDAGFFRHLVKRMEEDVFNEELPIDYVRLCGKRKRIFYYDALPAKKPSQKTIDHENALAEAVNLHEYLSSVPNLHVRTGISRYRKRRGQEQKGVDILLAIEAFRHAVQGNMDIGEIMTSDLDFYPVLEAFTGTRVRSNLIYDPRTTSAELVHAADTAEPANALSVLGWCKQEFQKRFKAGWIPWSTDVQGWVPEGRPGKYQGEPFELWFDQRNQLFVGCSHADHRILQSTSKAVVLGGFEDRPGIKVEI